MSEIPATTATRPSVDYSLLFTDFDGTVRHGYDELGRFVNVAADVVPFDEVPRLLHDHWLRGGLTVGVTNQGGIHLGHMTHEQCSEAIQATRVACTLSGTDPFFAVAYCPHDPKGDCWCRKPNPGMILNGAAEVNRAGFNSLGRSTSLMIGDRPEDRAAAERAGIDFRLASEWRAGE